MEIDEAREQLLASTGHLLIEGGPGSGKTTIALLKAAKTLSTLKNQQRVLFLSFSRAAVRQIRTRISQHLSYEVKERLEVRTFHAFFLEFVRAHGHLITGTSARCVPPDAEAQLKSAFDGDWDEETQALARQGVYVFDQLAATTALLLERSDLLTQLYCDKYPMVIVDEFQDTNVDQWRVVRALSVYSTIVCLADPDQRIFEGFVKGVDDARIEHAIETLNPTRFDFRGDNHRSSGNGILDYANAILKGKSTDIPEAVEVVEYGYPFQPEQVAHYVTVRLRVDLERQLGRTPSIAVLAPTSPFVGKISEAISSVQVVRGSALPPIDHELVWDPGLSAAAGYVVASILEWPGLSRHDAVVLTMKCVIEFYRVKVAGKETASARSSIKAMENALAAFRAGGTPRNKTGKMILEIFDRRIDLIGNPVADWQRARDLLRGTNELSEIYSKARLLRLLQASDNLAWGLNDVWNAENAYVSAVETVRQILANEVIDGDMATPHEVTLMNMHKSKGKEFDGVVIVEGVHSPKLLDPTWDAKRVTRQRRVIRVAVTRACHRVIFVRPKGAVPLTGPN